MLIFKLQKNFEFTNPKKNIYIFKSVNVFLQLIKIAFYQGAIVNIQPKFILFYLMLLIVYQCAKNNIYICNILCFASQLLYFTNEKQLYWASLSWLY